MPGAFNPLSARLIERKGFEGVYISGAVISADLGLPDIGLTTLSEVAGRGQQIARMTELPAIIDADTGFGEPMNVARTSRRSKTPGSPAPTSRTRSTRSAAVTSTARASWMPTPRSSASARPSTRGATPTS